MPKLYSRGQEKLGFNPFVFGTYIARSIYQGLICFFIPIMVMSTPYYDGSTEGNWYIGSSGMSERNAQYIYIIIIIFKNLIISCLVTGYGISAPLL